MIPTIQPRPLGVHDMTHIVVVGAVSSVVVSSPGCTLIAGTLEQVPGETWKRWAEEEGGRTLTVTGPSPVLAVWSYSSFATRLLASCQSAWQCRHTRHSVYRASRVRTE